MGGKNDFRYTKYHLKPVFTSICINSVTSLRLKILIYYIMLIINHIEKYYILRLVKNKKSNLSLKSEMEQV